MKKTYVLVLLSISLAFTACGKGDVAQKDGTQESRAQESDSPSGSAETGQADGSQAEGSDGSAIPPGAWGEFSISADETELAPREYATIQDFINSGAGNGFLHSSYETPAEICWDEVFYSGAGITSEYMLSGEELEEYLKLVGRDEVYTDITKLTTAQIEEFVRDKTGTDYKNALRPLSWVYSPKYDTYYFEHGDVNYMQYSVAYGSRVGDTVTLRVEPTEDWGSTEGGAYELVLKDKPGGGYYFYSNRLLWEEGTVEDQTFADIELSEYDIPVAAATYIRKDNGYPIIKIIRENEVADRLIVGGYEEWQNESFVSLDAVAFPDYDMDGNTDIIVVYTTTAGRTLDIFDGYDPEGMSWQKSFSDTEFGYRILEKIKQSNMDINMSEFKKYIGYQGKDYRFSSWQEAYRFIARLENIRYGADGSYDLIYFDGDDVPELVAGVNGYYVSMYTYADGRLYRVMDEWGYGAGGNHGYEYIPKGNKLYNLDVDGAGTDLYESIDMLDQNHKLKNVVEIHTINYDAIYENADVKEKSGSESFIDGKKISDAEYAGYFADRDQYRMIKGSYGYEELLRHISN